MMRISTAQLSAYEVGKKQPPKDVREALESLIECEGKRGLTDEEIKELRKKGQAFKAEMQKLFRCEAFRG